MTNKKFKLAAMSMALTACVAAQPLMANAADDVDTADASGNAPAPQAESTGTAAPASAPEEKQEEVRNEEKGAVDVIDDNTSVDYDHDQDKTTLNPDKSSTTESTGTVNKTESPANSKEETPKGGEETPQSGEKTPEDGEKAPESGEKTTGEDAQEPEKTPIGDAKMTETETKETEKVMDPSTTRPSGPSTSKDNDDGTTTITTPTITEGTETTTTTVTGEAKADTKDPTSTPSEKIDLDKELGGTLPKWDTSTGTTFGEEGTEEKDKYKVTDVSTSEDGKSQTLTMVKEKTEEGTMTGEDIAKLIEAGYEKHEDGTYTLTKEYTDSDGKTWTETVTVDESTATKKTTTTLTLTLKKTDHKDSTSVDETTDTGDKDLGTRYPTETTVKDKDGNKLWSGNVADLFAKAKAEGKSECSYTDEDGKTYTFKFSETEGEPDKTLNFSAEDVAKLLGDGYSYKDGKIYHVDGDKLAEVDYKQAIRQINLHIDLTVTEDKKEDHESVNQKDGQTIDAATAAAEKKAAEDALKDALKKAAREAGITDTDDSLNAALDAALASKEIHVDAEGSWIYKTTVGDVEKTFTFHYDKTTVSTSHTEASDSEKADVKKDNGEKIDDIKKNTSTGTAYVKDGSVLWAGSGKISEPADGSPLGNIGGDFKQEPDGATGFSYDSDGRIAGYTKDGKTYTFEYKTTELDDDTIEKLIAEAKAKGLTLDKDSIKGSLTTVTWTITEDKQDDTFTEKELSSNITEEEGGTYTIKVGDKTYTGLTKNKDGSYTGPVSNDANSKVTIVINATSADLTEGAVKNLLTNKVDPNATNITVDLANNSATYTGSDGKTYTVRYTSGSMLTLTATETTSTTEKKETITKDSLDDLVSEVASRAEKLNIGDKLKLGDKYTITKGKDGKYTLSDGKQNFDLGTAVNDAAFKETVKGKIKSWAINYINYDTLTPEEKWDLLDHQQGYADGSNNQYAGGTGLDSYWPEEKFENNKGDWVKNDKGETIWGAVKDRDGNIIGETPSQDTTHFDSLGLDADVTITTEDGQKLDGLLLNETLGEDYKLTFTYGHKEQIAGYVDLSKYPDKSHTGELYYKNNDEKKAAHPTTGAKDAALSTTITQKDGMVWNSTTRRYESNSKLTYTFKDDQNTNTFDGKRFYNITGKVAYNKIDGEFGKDDAEAKVAALKKAGKEDAICVPVKLTTGTVYYVYENVAEVKALGYMTASANTSNKQNLNGWTPGNNSKTPYNGSVNAGDYELRIQGLVLHQGRVEGEYGTQYKLDLTTIRNKITGTGTGSNTSLTLTDRTYKDTTSGSDYLGSWTGTYSDTFDWTKKEDARKTTGTGSSWFYSFKKLFTDRKTGSEDISRKEGTINADYATSSDATVVLKGEDAPTMETVVETHSTVKYHFTHTETKDVIEEGKQIITITPDDGGDTPVTPVTPETPPVQDATPDAPVIPTDAVLPPVQDATPDAPVLPTAAVLPAVQDAHALPQTGVNWLTAIGLALSGFSLMVGGAWASLTGKNAKH